MTARVTESTIDAPNFCSKVPISSCRRHCIALWPRLGGALKRKQFIAQAYIVDSNDQMFFRIRRRLGRLETGVYMLTKGVTKLFIAALIAENNSSSYLPSSHNAAHDALDLSHNLLLH
jgi:hypothetical protein